MWALLVGCGSNGTVAPPGDPSRFDPLARLPEVAAFAGEGARLVEMDARGLRADGTLDLTLEPSRAGVGYTFVREVPAPPDAPPVGAGGSLDGRYHETVEVRLWEPGQWRHVSSGGSEWTYRHRGMERTPTVAPGGLPADLPPAPRCRSAELWQGLAGAPAGAEATLDYDRDGYQLRIRGTEIRAEFDAGCRPRPR